MANTFKLKTKANIDASLVAVYTAPSGITSTVIIGLTLANITSASITANVQLVTNSTTGENADDPYIVKAIPIPSGSSVEVMAGNKIVMQASDVLKVGGSATNSVDATLSIMEITP
jgi:hypothetical protein